MRLTTKFAIIVVSALVSPVAALCQINNPSASSGGGGTTINCASQSGADDSLKVQACFAALYALNTQAGVADARGLTANVWSINPFDGGNIPASGMLLLPPGNITVSVPILVHDNWGVQGIAPNANSGINNSNVGTINTVGTVLVASSSFPQTYSTGTITPGFTGSTPAGGTQGAAMVITGVGTTWNASTVTRGCAFVAPAGGVQGNSTVGIIASVTDTTHIVLGSGMNGGLAGGSAASGGSSYDIYCPVLITGLGGVEASAGYEYGMPVINLGLDANNRTGVVPYMNWFGGQGTYAQNVVAMNFNSFGFDVEGNYTEESGPYTGLQSYPGSSSSTNTVPIFIAYNGGAGTWSNLTVRKGPGTIPAAGIVVEGSNIVGENWDVEGYATGVAINKNLTCSPACLFPSAFTWGPATNMHLTGITGSGTTALHIYSVNGSPNDISIRNVNSTVFSTLLVDDPNSCTIAVNPEFTLGEYTLDITGLINHTTSHVTTCQPRSSTAAGFLSGGTKFTASGCSNGTTVGGAAAGRFTIGAATCTVVITINGATGLTAPNGWSCKANDVTTVAGNTGLYFSANNATTATLTVPSTAVASDIIDFHCVGY